MLKPIKIVTKCQRNPKSQVLHLPRVVQQVPALRGVRRYPEQRLFVPPRRGAAEEGRLRGRSGEDRDCRCVGGAHCGGWEELFFLVVF